MDLLNIIKQRRSIRAFEKGRLIKKEVIDKILTAAIYAPTAGNVQPWRFFVITNEKIKDALVDAAYGQDFISQSSVVIVVCASLNEAAGSYGKRGLELYSVQDTAAAIQNMLLVVHSEGLGACWVGAFSEEEASRILKLPKDLRPIAILPIGYPKESPTTPRRKSFDAVVKWIE